MNGSAKGRQPWKYQKDAKEYHRKSGYAAFTMVFNQSLEAEMMDTGLAKESRVLAAIKRFSWGRFSDFAVHAMPALEVGDPKPAPLTQEALGRILNLSPASMSQACVFLKEGGYLRKDHPNLFPEKKTSTLESVKDSGVNSDSFNSRSPYLRFKSSYLAENKDLSEIITQIAEERNRLQDGARLLSTEMRRHERVILAAFRDWEREHPDEQPQENQQNEPDSETTLLPTRLCAHAQNELPNTGESKANQDYISTISHMESDSNSKMEYFTTPEPPPLESESHSTKKPNKSGPRSASSLKPLKSEEKIDNTTTTEEAPPPSPSSPFSVMVPKEWREELTRIFTRARKPAPLPAQVTAAYLQIIDDWQEFLKWLPSAPQFKRTQHPGGLPSLIQFFTADRQPAPAPADPESMTKEEIENYWKTRFAENPAERKDIESMYPELFRSEVA